MRRKLAVALLAGGCLLAQRPVYRVYVACESADEVHRVAFDGKRAIVERKIEVGYQPTDIEGPHGLTVGLDGKHWYLSIAHGKPFGMLYKYRTGDDALVGECELGMFPATMQISRATGLLYCVNFNLHGRMLPSSVSIVDPDAMVEVGRTVTGSMPHGSRLSADGRTHYSCAMMSGELYEIDAASFKVKRRLQLGIEPPAGHASEAKPTWVSTHPTARRVYCALNGAAVIVEVDLDQWAISRRWPCAKGPYNLDVSSDGRRLVASYKTAGEIGIWDLAAGQELERLPSSRPVTHGVVISPDNRFAFVTAEGRNSEPGALDVIDLDSNELVATVPVGLQAGGIAFFEIAER
ncbi:MAG: YncE family protein [Planctomycetes bacterium]|nr:YncE family protein [Planctomycetota bacterium]